MLGPLVMAATREDWGRLRMGSGIGRWEVVLLLEEEEEEGNND